MFPWTLTTYYELNLKTKDLFIEVDNGGHHDFFLKVTPMKILGDDKVIR